MSLSDKAIDELIGIEGGYSDHPSDAGGKTRFGITEYLARAYGYQGAISDLPHNLARYIYREEFWRRLSLDDVSLISYPVAKEIFDSAVNIPSGRIVGWFQRVLNALNRGGKDYADIVVDEHLGPATVAAFHSLIAKRGSKGEKAVLRAMNALQGAYYIERSESRQQNEDFLLGWLLNRVVAP